MTKLSIIVPVYNVERYLPVCLDSIRNQTFRDIEIICVDDGSTDRSSNILEMYSKVEPRMRIISKENGGLSSARNAGIRCATGDIVCFVDSDDFLDKTAAKRITDAFDSTHADLITFGGRVYPQFLSNWWLNKVLSPRDTMYASFDPSLFALEAAEPFAWRTACRREFLIEERLWFDEELRFGEDKLFHYMAYPRSRKTVFLSDKLYDYRVNRADSLMATRNDDKVLRIYDHLRISDRICSDWKQSGNAERFGSQLLSLIGEFVFMDVMTAPVQDRTMLANFLKSILETYFSDVQLKALLHDREYGAMARAILIDRRRLFGARRKMMFYLGTLRNNPIDFLRRGRERLASLGAVLKMRQMAGRIFPPSSRTVALRHLESEFVQKESVALLNSIELLRIELGNVESEK